MCYFIVVFFYHTPMKKTLVMLSLLFTVLSGCGQKNAGPTTANPFEDLCSYFPKQLVETAIQKPIVHVEKSSLLDPSCSYYTQYLENYEITYSGDKKPGGPHVIVVYDTQDFARDKIINEKSGTTYETDPTIGMDNVVMRNTSHQIWQTALVLGNDKYIRIKAIDKAVSGNDLVNIARAFAQKLKNDPFLHLNTTPVNTTSSNTTLSTSSTTNSDPQTVVTHFFDALRTHHIQDALENMDANNDIKQAWGVNFNTITSLKLMKITEAFPEEWTPTHQSFQVELDVSVKPEGEQLGWKNGKNIRWITLEKNKSGQWLIHELANNP